jgi:hypothetical protein
VEEDGKEKDWSRDKMKKGRGTRVGEVGRGLGGGGKSRRG